MAYLLITFSEQFNIIVCILKKIKLWQINNFINFWSINKLIQRVYLFLTIGLEGLNDFLRAVQSDSRTVILLAVTAIV